MRAPTSRRMTALWRFVGRLFRSLRGLRRPLVSHDAVRRLQVDPDDDRGRALLRRGGDLNPSTRRIWRLLLAERAWTHVIDVGANYGEMLIGVSLPEQARIIAFEPSPLIAPHLEQNLVAAGVKATVVRSAVSDRVGVAELLVNRKWSGRSRLRQAPDQAEESVAVPTTTIAHVLGGAAATAGLRVLIKIDVEGHESRVLAGLLDLVDHFAEFAALVEVLHLPQHGRDWIIEHFDVELFDPASTSNPLVRLVPATSDGLQAALRGGRFYGQDVVLRRKG